MVRCYLCVHMNCAFTYRGQGSVSGVFVRYSPLPSLFKECHWTWRSLFWPVSPRATVLSAYTSTLALTWMLGVQIKAAMLAEQTLCPLMSTHSLFASVSFFSLYTHTRAQSVCILTHVSENNRNLRAYALFKNIYF